MTMCHFNRIKRLRKRTNLVYLNQNCIAGSHCDTFLQEAHVGNKQVITYELYFIANSFGQFNPAFPVVFIKAVFNRIDRIFLNELFQISDLLIVRKLLAIRILRHATLQLFVVIEIFTIFYESKLTSCAVHCNLNVFTRFVTCIFDSLNNAI